MRTSFLCCGIHLENAVRIVGIVDVVLGVFNFTFIFLYFKIFCILIQNESCCVTRHEHGRMNNDTNNCSFDESNETLPLWIIIIILACTIIQCVLGIVISVAAVTKNRKLCLIWLFVTGVICLFSGFLLFIRLYQIFVINEFCDDLENEQSQVDSMFGICPNRGPINAPPAPLQSFPIQQLQVSVFTQAENVTVTRNHRNHSSHSESSTASPPTPPPSSASHFSLEAGKKEEPPPSYHIAINFPPALDY